MKPKSTLSVFAAENQRIANGKVVFRREGDAYSLSNGVMSIHGEMCGERLAQSIRLGGHDCGSLDVLLKVADGEGGWTWPGVKSLCSIAYRELNGAGVLDLIGEWWLVVDRWKIPGIALRVHVRLTIRPSEPLSCVNSLTSPILVRRN